MHAPLSYASLHVIPAFYEQILEAGAPVYVPTTLSLTAGHQPGAKPTPQEEFFIVLEEDVKRINDFTMVRPQGRCH